MLTIKDVCAVIVSYQCDAVIKGNIESLRTQSGHLVIVDNGSDDRARQILSEYAAHDQISVIYNAANEGIAQALNQGLAYAADNHYPLILTMDQDTVLFADAVQRMLDVLNQNPAIVSVGPGYQGTLPASAEAAHHAVQYLITSGNLTYVERAVLIGGFNEKLFIDDVDFDFSLALRDAGGQLAIADLARMRHKIGEPETVKLLFFRIKLQSHSPVRHYYMFRNHIYIWRKYFRRYPLFCVKKELLTILYFLQVLVVQTQKREKLRMICKGVRDAYQNTYGKMPAN